MMKTINDTLTTNEYNGIISLLRQHTHKDNITIKDNVTGEYGDYQFTLEGVTLLDNGILITDETITAQPKVKLTNPVFTEATYTLKLEVLHYTNVDILDTHTNYKVIDTLEIPLTPDTITNIPVNRLEGGYIISFNPTVIITHDKTIRQGEMTIITLATDKNTITTGETATLTITATDLQNTPIPNLEIGLYKNSILYDTLTTDENGQATETITGTGAGTLTFQAKHNTIESNTISIADSTQDNYELTLTSDKQIMMTGETATLTSTLTNNNVPVSGETVTFIIKHGSTTIDTATATTNNNGIATTTYTGTGAGDVSFYATYGTVQSQTYVVEDCLFFDDMTSANADWSFDSGLTPSYSSDGMYLGGVSSWKNAKLSNKSFSFPCSFEFDITQIYVPSSAGSVSVEFKLTHSDYNTLFISPTQYNGIRLNGSSAQSSWTSLSAYTGHYKLSFTSATTCTLYKEDTEVTTTTNISVNNLQVLFGLGANNRSMTIKNVKIKPL